MKRNDRFAAVLCIISGLVLIAIAGCDEPARRPCCPDKCQPSIDVVWFSATWCRPCREQEPEVRVVLQGLSWRKVDIDRDPALAASYNVRVVPTYVVRVNGEERARTNSAADLRRMLGRK